MLKTCTGCGVEFTTPKGTKHYCTRECWKRSVAPKPKTCRACGKDFTPTSNHKEVVLCSVACRHIDKRAPRRPAFIRAGVGYVPLPHDRYALVDEADFERVMQRAWCENGRGTVVTADGAHRMQRLNRFIMQAHDGQLVDHGDGNQLNNRRKNLRIADSQQNAFNRRKMSRPTRSQYKGVTLNGKRWKAEIRLAGRITYLGNFSTQVEASHAYDAAARVHYGAFACVNHPIGNERPARTKKR